MSYGCDDPYKHELEGRDASRYREDYGHEHKERMREARWGSYDSCDAAYARGYQREQRYREELRQEEREREEYEMRQALNRAEEARQIDEAEYYAAQEQYPEPPYDHGPSYPEHEAAIDRGVDNNMLRVSQAMMILTGCPYSIHLQYVEVPEQLVRKLHEHEIILDKHRARQLEASMISFLAKTRFRSVEENAA